MAAKKRYLVVGTGAIGSLVAELLAADGHTVTTISRRGTGPKSPLITNVAGSANDAALLAKQAKDAACDG
jgi:predicted dinucleotide-binding enzyme